MSNTRKKVGYRSMFGRRKLFVICYVLIGLLLIFVLNRFLPIFSTLTSILVHTLLPLSIALIISYFLTPILDKMTGSLNMNRTSAIVLIFTSFFTLLGFAIYRGLPKLFFELQQLSEQLPTLIYLYESFTSSIYESTSFLPEAIQEQLLFILIDLETSLELKLESVLQRFIASIDYLVSFLIVPILVFYFLKDGKQIRQYVIERIPKVKQAKFNLLMEAIHKSLGSYLRGQAVLSFFIFAISWFSYYFIGLPYAFILSIFLGVMNVIPYFGPILGTIPAILIALSSSWQLVIYVIVIAIWIQLMESAFLSPYIMGKTAKLHPIVIIFLLIVSHEIGGIFAMIIAIPSVMIIRNIVEQLASQKQQCIDN